MTRTPTPVTYELLDEMSGQGDELADDVMRRQVEWLRTRAEGPGDDAPRRLLRDMATHLRVPPQEELSPYDEYLAADEMQLPDWATGPEGDERCRRGAAFFAEWAVHIGTALFCGSLPAGYASPRGARVLALTGRLGEAPVRRVAETAQFLIDVMTDGALDQSLVGYEAIQRVRMMHAAIRYFVIHDPSLPRTHFHPAPAGGWCDAWGTPINQEDLLGGLLTFTVTVFEVLDKLGVEYDPADAEDYLFRWCVIGHLMGIRSDVLPLDRKTAEEAAALIRGRQCEHSVDGCELTSALIEALQGTMPRRISNGLIPATVRWYLGDEMADVLDVKPNLWTRVLKGPVAELIDLQDAEQRRLARLRDRRRAVAATGYERVMRRIGDAAIKGFLDANRPGDGRPPFQLPTELRSNLLTGPRRFRLT